LSGEEPWPGPLHFSQSRGRMDGVTDGVFGGREMRCLGRSKRGHSWRAAPPSWVRSPSQSQGRATPGQGSAQWLRCGSSGERTVSVHRPRGECSQTRWPTGAARPGLIFGTSGFVSWWARQPPRAGVGRWQAPGRGAEDDLGVAPAVRGIPR